MFVADPRRQTRSKAMPLDVLLAGRRNRNHLKLRLIKLGLKSLACEECGLQTWRGLPVSLQLHHVNGVGQDNTLENLRLLCPNCHSQTENWGGRNARLRQAFGQQPEGDGRAPGPG